MIPLKLHIKNFLSYGSPTQTINFEPYHLICLTGKNGHGKSALLDAITWAVWGQARKTSGTGRVEDGLIKLGQTEMMVAIDFLCNDTHYRIRREYTIQASKATVQLDFGIVETSETGTSTRPLSEKQIRATQDIIIKHVGLDYDSFTNSAFLKQGQANEFSKKSPRERKEILSTILGLGPYEILRKKAVEKSKIIQQELAVLQKIQEQLEKEITQKECLESEYTRYVVLRAQLDEKHEQFKKTQETLTRTRQEYEQQESTQRMHANQQDQEKQTYQTYTKLLVDKIKIKRQLLRDIKKLKQHDLVSMHTLELVDTHIDLHNLDKNKLHGDLNKIDIRLAQKTAELDAHKKLLLDTQNTLAQTQNIIKNLEEQEQTHTLEIVGARIVKEQKIFERRKEFYHLFVSRGNTLKRTREELLYNQKSVTSARAYCPLCQQSLDKITQETVYTQFVKNSLHAEHQIKRVSRVLSALKEQLVSDYECIKNLNKTYEIKKNNYTRAQELTYDCTKQEQKISELKTCIVQKEHEKIELEHTKKQYLTLLYRCYIRESDAYTHEIDKLSQQVKLVKTRQNNYVHTRVILDINTLEQNETMFFLEYKKHIVEREQVIQKLGALTHHRELIGKKEDEHIMHTYKLKELKRTYADYQVIAHALGKDGIQALLIEDALPDIEEEANKLLAKLTDNHAHILIESLKDLKSGATKETLDIKISDTLGIRSYELFSGGEAFRIDFALRIAISKLLAKRAGAKLQLLIIDEGFGSQDDDGLTQIMDTLHKIQDDFVKIIIVSHLPGMKDQFPAQFVIKKTTQGSTVQVVEQG